MKRIGSGAVACFLMLGIRVAGIPVTARAAHGTPGTQGSGAAPSPKKGDDEAARRRQLAAAFAPRPGQAALFKPALLRDFVAGADVMAVHGVIVVTPLRGSCLYVTRHADEPDVRVCRKSPLAFAPRHLAADGSVQWRVTREGETEGTTLTWPTPYRMARLMPQGDDAMTADREAPVVACAPIPGRGARTLHVDVLGEAPLTVTFPATDVPLSHEAEQNLIIAGRDPKAEDSSPDEGKFAASGETTPEAHGDAKKPAGEGHGEAKKGEHGEAKGESHGTAATESTAAPTKAGAAGEKSKNPPKTLWRLPARGSFAMSADHVATLGLPGGALGQCRYRLRGAPGDPESGVVECHRTDRYRYLYLPLPCVKAFRPP